MKNYYDSPYYKIPEELKIKYSMNNEFKIIYEPTDDSVKNEVIWKKSEIDNYRQNLTLENIKNNQEGWTPYGNKTSLDIINSIIDNNVINKNVAVIGSQNPWIEAILLNYNNKVTTIEYNLPKCNYDNLKIKNYFEFELENNNFDVIITFSSVEHSGLGRYGDPLNPDGDIETMNSIYNNLKKDGLLIWGAPVCEKDGLVWNKHRIYGPKRLLLLFKKFKYISSSNNLFKKKWEQPVIILKKIN